MWLPRRAWSQAGIKAQAAPKAPAIADFVRGDDHPPAMPFADEAAALNAISIVRWVPGSADSRSTGGDSLASVDVNPYLAMAATLEDGQLQVQPVFCLMATTLMESLVAFTQGPGLAGALLAVLGLVVDGTHAFLLVSQALLDPVSVEASLVQQC